MVEERGVARGSLDTIGYDTLSGQEKGSPGIGVTFDTVDFHTYVEIQLLKLRKGGCRDVETRLLDYET